MRLIDPFRRPLLLFTAIGEGALEVTLALVREVRYALAEPAPAPLASEPVGTRAAERSAPPAPPAFRAKARPRARPSSRPPRSPASAPAPAPPAPPVPDKVKTIHDEPIPVAEFAERGAEDAAGAEVHVDAPWEGYDAMTVADVKPRLADADRELLAAVVLYEGFGAKRRSVIEAAEKRLTRLSVPGS